MVLLFYTKKIKMNKKTKFGLRLESELKERLEALAKNIEKPVSEVIRDILWNVVLEPRKYFASCPVCGVEMFDATTIGVNGIMETNCVNGHKQLYNTESQEFVSEKQAIEYHLENNHFDFAFDFFDESLFTEEKAELKKWKDLQNLLSKHYRILSADELNEYQRFLENLKSKIKNI